MSSSVDVLIANLASNSAAVAAFIEAKADTDDLPAPAWLNKDFFDKNLRENGGKTKVNLLCSNIRLKSMVKFLAVGC